MKKGILLGALSAGLLSGLATAGSVGPSAPEWRWVGVFSAEPVWARGGATQTLYMTSDMEVRSRANKAIKTHGVLSHLTYTA